ncbi:elongation factor-like GTPase 1 [Neltuma alba]|uniref:elongation factor-like GTPase 1 n=1 Tax=Neltuma alba TaxID=207710 RepID=UPI0010A315F0|nr:elongation factor-like GTPase 1 [Prosopis alba]XP_028758606.1 elongation factor-like GTPase 1 [Prosopis alba]XP_028758607.1 elongation factor-like GTPase 1 [Prosopis alba]XP_028758608.1 elongation factor-like GTPase 1 [Prosopis alba]XP_028758609.1 elongation factor-like GTPase 1 [Prosopis alba]XP_028758610.1 elongation factor-like GTPase 1 [Prosopis alba]XP_028758611.1 elongation factor-like GTPase 1 [Prosopis alba]XP_028758612.1 elongation factor-like GTPase 1 [Prosopis alba]
MQKLCRMEDDFDTGKIRNICILAHVDHGKTTLADHLIAASGGGLLHPKLAGRIRFMDYLDEEQRRAITMKSSSIALHYKDYSINLIDSPGHMDFCSEVSTAARLSDGALILVDAVEGVHIQTHAVLRQCWIEKLSPCLVLNKIDRLISELKLSPMEAYIRLLRIVHEVNGIISTYKSEKYLSDVDSILAGPSGDVTVDENIDLIEDDDEDMFQPQKGNVGFVCALDGWGFRVHEFAEFYASKLGASVTALQKALWGPRYFNSKTKMIVGKKGVGGGSKARPMFVQFVLEPLWQVYQGALEGDGDKGMLEKVIKSFNLSIPSRELQNKDPKLVLQAVMSRWLPLSDTILSMVVKCMPDPASAQSFRISRLLPKREVLDNGVDQNVLAEAELVRKSVEECDWKPEAPCVAFVSKMFAVPIKMLPDRGSYTEVVNYSGDGEGESDECFLAFARIFSGTLSARQKVFVLSALYDPLKGEQMQKHVQEAELQSLYLMMGQGLKVVTSAKAGNIVAIRGLGQHILKSATLSSSKNCWPFSGMAFQVAPTLRVAIEPSDPAEISALLKGLRLLNRADPFVEVTVSARGEHVLAAAGEVHLERCVKDLKERFAKVSLEVSPPLVSYKETIEGEVSSMLENLKALSKNSDYVEKTTPNGRCVVRVHVMKLPSSLTKVLDDSSDVLGDVIGIKSGHPVKNLDSQRSGIHEIDNPTALLKKRIMDALESEILSKNENDEDYVDKCKTKWLKLLRRIWALGPRQIGPNILFTPDVKAESSDGSILISGDCHVSERVGFADDSSTSNAEAETPSNVNEALDMEAKRLESSVISGFQLATAAGPLCDEPMWGLAFVIEAYIYPHLGQNDEPEAHQQSEQYGIFAGQIITTVKDACRAAVLQNRPRLVEAMYFCELNTPTEYLGPMYAVLARRRARVLKEEMQEGSPFFTVHAYLPVSESFGFADELRRWTSGAASVLLVLSHWEALNEDPFFVPKTEEEIEEFGDGSSVLPNTARKLVNAVRRRKGLHVEEKIVQHGTKQRTRARKV